MMVASSKLTRVRGFSAADIPQVAEVHRRAFKTIGASTPELQAEYQAYFTQVFLNNPWRSEDIQPLVYQEDDGQISGFLGVLPQRMSLRGQTVRVAIMTNFVVNPDARGLAGAKLLRAFLDGPQDLAIADEASPGVRKMWEGLGGTTSLPYSMHWYYLLRPVQFGVLVLKQKQILPSHLVKAASPLARALDVFSERILKFPFRPSKPALYAEELTVDLLLQCLSEAAPKQSLRPAYDSISLGWLLDRADQMRGNGNMRKALLKTDKGDVAGWYLYYSHPGGLSQIVQVYTKPNRAHDVLDHLFNDAWVNGVTALSGRLDPALMYALSERHAVFFCGPEWALIHSRKPEILNAFDRSDVYFSRLEGEWCTHFR